MSAAMQSTMSRSLVQTPMAQSQRPTMRARSAFLVRASAEDTSRRAIMGLFCASTASLLATGAALAKVKNPAQDSIKRGGSSTEASMSAFNMEGIKKRGLKAGARKELMQAAKEKAQQLSSKIGG